MPIEIPIKLNAETRFILGRPFFWCGTVAKSLRQVGHTIPNTIEDEQAYVINHMLTLYHRHGTKFMDKLRENLNIVREVEVNGQFSNYR